MEKEINNAIASCDSVSHAARLMGVSNVYLTKIIKRKEPISWNMAFKFQKVFNINAHDIMKWQLEQEYEARKNNP